MPARVASAVLRRISLLVNLSNLFKHFRQTEFGVDVETFEALLADGVCLSLRLELRKFLHVLIPSKHQSFTAGPALQCLLLQLQGIADAPCKKRTDGKYDKPGVDTHGAGNYGAARCVVVLRKNRYRAD